MVTIRFLYLQVEKNESIIEAAVRELQEETGLIALPQNLNKIGLFEYEFTNPSLVPFIMEASSQLINH